MQANGHPEVSGSVSPFETQVTCRRSAPLEAGGRCRNDNCSWEVRLNRYRVVGRMLRLVYSVYLLCEDFVFYLGSFAAFSSRLCSVSSVGRVTLQLTAQCQQQLRAVFNGKVEVLHGIARKFPTIPVFISRSARLNCPGLDITLADSFGAEQTFVSRLIKRSALH